MGIFRENSRLISRLFVNQIGMTIFGLVLTMAVMRATGNNNALIVAVSLFSIVFYLCLIYNVMWEEGARNSIRINAGRMEKDRAFPLRVALLASVPNLVLALVFFVSYLLAYPCHVEFAKALYAALHIILGLFEAMYVGLFGVILDAFPVLETQALVACVLYFLSSLPMILISWLAYFFGARGIYIFGKRSSGKGNGK